MTDKRIGGITIPDSTVAREATELARESLPLEIFNHCMRTFLFAELIAKANSIRHDAELVYVASILHDTGMSPRHMSDAAPFEVDGADVARSLLLRHGIAGARVDLAWDAIALHDNGGIAQRKAPEVVLVNSGVSADFGGSLERLERADVRAVLAFAPRTRFIEAFLDASAAVAKRKPLASAHSFVADVGYRRVPGFHLPNFCDAVRTDPFATYR